MEHSLLQPRGIRNNNPGNIRIGKTRWRGQSAEQRDSAFIEFDTPLYGLRALMRTLLTYHLKHGLDTVESIVNRWAPPHENATDHYAFHVAKLMKVHRTAALRLTEAATLKNLARAIVRHENGAPQRPGTPSFWYPDALYDAAAQMALETLTPA